MIMITVKVDSRFVMFFYNLVCVVIIATKDFSHIDSKGRVVFPNIWITNELVGEKKTVL